jgi:hypothetical protein
MLLQQYIDDEDWVEVERATKVRQAAAFQNRHLSDWPEGPAPQPSLHATANPDASGLPTPSARPAAGATPTPFAAPAAGNVPTPSAAPAALSMPAITTSPTARRTPAASAAGATPSGGPGQALRAEPAPAGGAGGFTADAPPGAGLPGRPGASAGWASGNDSASGVSGVSRSSGACGTTASTREGTVPVPGSAAARAPAAVPPHRDGATPIAGSAGPAPPAAPNPPRQGAVALPVSAAPQPHAKGPTANAGSAAARAPMVPVAPRQGAVPFPLPAILPRSPVAATPTAGSGGSRGHPLPPAPRQGATPLPLPTAPPPLRESATPKAGSAGPRGRAVPQAPRQGAVPLPLPAAPPPHREDAAPTPGSAGPRAPAVPLPGLTGATPSSAPSPLKHGVATRSKQASGEALSQAAKSAGALPRSAKPAAAPAGRAKPIGALPALAKVVAALSRPVDPVAVTSRLGKTALVPPPATKPQAGGMPVPPPGSGRVPVRTRWGTEGNDVHSHAGHGRSNADARTATKSAPHTDPPVRTSSVSGQGQEQTPVLPPGLGGVPVNPRWGTEGNDVHSHAAPGRRNADARTAATSAPRSAPPVRNAAVSGQGQKQTPVLPPASDRIPVNRRWGTEGNDVHSHAAHGPSNADARTAATSAAQNDRPVRHPAVSGQEREQTPGGSTPRSGGTGNHTGQVNSTLAGRSSASPSSLLCQLKDKLRRLQEQRQAAFQRQVNAENAAREADAMPNGARRDKQRQIVGATQSDLREWQSKLAKQIVDVNHEIAVETRSVNARRAMVGKSPLALETGVVLAAQTLQSPRRAAASGVTPQRVAGDSNAAVHKTRSEADHQHTPETRPSGARGPVPPTRRSPARAPIPALPVARALEPVTTPVVQPSPVPRTASAAGHPPAPPAGSVRNSVPSSSGRGMKHRHADVDNPGRGKKQRGADVNIAVKRRRTSSPPRRTEDAPIVWDLTGDSD